MRSIKSALLLTVALAATPLFAANVGGVNLEDKITVGNQSLVLNGAGIRKKFFIKVYVGALYTTARERDAARISAADTPRRLLMHFLFDVDKEKISEAWTEGLTDNTPNASAEVKKNFATLESWMQDMKKGQRIVMTYVPGTGTTVEVNGKVKGTLPGKATSDAILATWTGPKPGPGDDFKSAVLGT
jgi:hypothetical protein